MKVVCDNCRAVYKVPDEKLVKAVNKATCRQCSHKMLIPRPKPNQDPNEATLVTAVPPTPAGAPARSFSNKDNGHSSRKAEEVPVFPGTPAPSPLRAGNYGPGRPEDFAGSSTLVSDKPPGMPSSNQETAIRPSPLRSQGTPSSALVRRPTPMPVPMRTPGPAMYRQQQATYDPASDLNWALLGSATALAGAGMLSILSIYNHPMIMWFGLAMSFGGTILSFMVLLTGARGRQPAKVIGSVLAGFFVAVLMATTLVATKWGAEKAIDVLDINFLEDPNIQPVVEQPVLMPKPAVPGQADLLDPIEVEPVDVAPVVPEPAKPEPVKAEPTKPAPVKPAPVRPKPPPRPQPVAPPPAPVRPAPVAPAPAPATAKPSKVPMQVVNVMMKNNNGVKKCFVPMAKAGTMPKRVDVSLTIQPTGRPTGISVVQPALRPPLQGCLTTAITRIQFPEAQNPTKLTFPYILQ